MSGRRGAPLGRHVPDTNHRQNVRAQRAGLLQSMDQKVEQAGRAKMQRRMQIANEAMAFARHFINEPANVERFGYTEEGSRWDEYYNNERTRLFLDNYIMGSTQQKNPTVSGTGVKYGVHSGAAQIKREGKCMEMSALVLSYLGGKVKHYQKQLARHDIGAVARRDYQQKLNDINSVQLMGGNKKDTNHMWVRIGDNDDRFAVSADAWGRGGAVASTQYAGRDVFSENIQSQHITPTMLRNVHKVSKQILGDDHLSNYLATSKDMKHRRGSYDGISGAPSLNQHRNQK